MASPALVVTVGGWGGAVQLVVLFGREALERNVRIRASDDRAGVLGFRVVHRSGQAVVLLWQHVLGFRVVHRSGQAVVYK